MKYPKLVPPFLACTPCTLKVQGESVDEDGAPVTLASIEARCNWQSVAATTRTAQKHTVKVNGVALFDGDICPAVPVISAGVLKVNGEQRSIVRGTKERNPDGSVNFTRIEVE